MRLIYWMREKDVSHGKGKEDLWKKDIVCGTEDLEEKKWPGEVELCEERNDV